MDTIYIKTIKIRAGAKIGPYCTLSFNMKKYMTHQIPVTQFIQPEVITCCSCCLEVIIFKTYISLFNGICHLT